MFLAHRAGIRVFATGGVGGVHRVPGSSPSALPSSRHDISADLTELASTPVAVICAGAKAILDIPATLEFLETNGVPVLSYLSEEFPAFYSRSSGLRAQARVDSMAQASSIIKTHWALGNRSGVVIGVPIPREAEIPRVEIEPFIERALREAEVEKVSGGEVTPFLLSRLAELTEGRSVQANIALLMNNVAVAAELAKSLEE
jgi:pseudouridylate synthase